MRKYIAAALVALGIAPAFAQSIGGNASISGSVTTARVAIPASVLTYPMLLIRPSTGTTVEVFFVLGDVTVTATTSSPALPSGGICLAAGANTHVAAITSTGTSTVRITQMSTCPLFG